MTLQIIFKYICNVITYGKTKPLVVRGKRFKTAGERCAAIIGSAIYNAPEPAKAAEEFHRWRNSFLEKRG